MQRILVVDDDESVRETIGILLERENFTPISASDGRSGLEKILALKPEMILLDLCLPGMSGIDLCRHVRTAQIKTPIIVLSGIGEEIDKVLLLEIGADDYLVKPFGTRELVARIRAVFRRGSPDLPKILSFSDFEIDFNRRAITRKGQEIRFTPAEYNLLTFFVQNADRVLTRDMILNSVWGYESYPNTRTVDAHVVRLRQKLENEPAIPRHFVTVHGVGYRFLP
jgi:DNA-binding response OmpR family regulator